MSGWFTFKLAEHGLFALGVEAHENRIQVARLAALHESLERVAFAQLAVTPTSARDLPTVDVTLCLSVFHHLVRFNSLEYAQSTMKRLAERTRLMMFFETGQSNEVDQVWAGQMSFMGDDPHGWVDGFLISLGFDRVEKIGESSGYRTEQPRGLYIAVRDTPV